MPSMRRFFDVVRRWLTPTASAVRADTRVIVVNETGGFVYEVAPDGHSSEHVDLRVKEPYSEPSALTARTNEG